MPLAWALARAGRPVGAQPPRRLRRGLRSQRPPSSGHPPRAWPSTRDGTFGTIGAARGTGPPARLRRRRHPRSIINVSATLGVAASRRALTTGATVRNVYTGLSGSMAAGWRTRWCRAASRASPMPSGPCTARSTPIALTRSRRLARARRASSCCRAGSSTIHACGRYIHAWALDSRRDSDGQARVRAGVDPRHPRADLRHWRPASATRRSGRSSAPGSRCPSPWRRSCATVGRAWTTHEAAAVADPRIHALARRVGARTLGGGTPTSPAPSPSASRPR